MNYDNFTNTTLFQHNEVSWYWLIRNTPTFSTFIITVRSSHDEYFFLNFSGVSDALREQHSIHFNLSVQCETTEDTLYTNCRCRQGCCLLLYLMRTHVKSLLYYFPRFFIVFLPLYYTVSLIQTHHSCFMHNLSTSIFTNLKVSSPRPVDR